MANYPSLKALAEMVETRLHLPTPIVDFHDDLIQKVVRSEVALDTIDIEEPDLPAYLKPIAAPAFDEVSIPSQIQYRVIELNLSELTGLIGIFLPLRDRWYAMSEEASETIIRLRLFFREMSIREKEILAGVYAEPAVQAASNLEKVNNLILKNETALRKLNPLFENGPPGEHLNADLTLSKLTKDWFNILDASVGAIGDASKAGTGIQHRQLLWQRWAIDKLGWELQSMEQQFQLTQAKIDIERAKQVLAISKEEVSFRLLRDKADYFASLERMEAFMNQGGAVDYPSRLEAARADMLALWEMIIPRALQLERGFRHIYGFESACPRPRNCLDIDTVSAWTNSLEEFLRLRKREEHTLSVAIPLSSKLNGRTLSDALDQGFEFDIQEIDTLAQRIRLRGINIVSVGGRPTFVPLMLQPPSEGYAIEERQSVVDHPLIFGTTRNLSLSGEDIKVLFSDAVWNVEPYGKWRIKSFKKLNEGDVEDFIVTLFGVGI